MGGRGAEYLRDYQVRVNASPSDVVSTMNTEAPATVKYVAALLYLSHEFLALFRNCLFDEIPEQFPFRHEERQVRAVASRGRARGDISD